MDQAVTILYNARIYSLDDQHTQAGAIAIRNGKVLALGSPEQVRAEFTGEVQAEDMHGQVILPGLVDAHIHLEHYALSLNKINCETTTLQECLQRVAEAARRIPEGQWILGHGWNQNNWAEGFGSAADLDAVAPNHPVYLTAKSLHAGWVNSQALRIAGITSQTPDPLDGKIGRDARNELDGLLFETAMQSVAQHIPEPGVSEVELAISQAQHVLRRMGLTGVHDFDRRLCFSALQHLHQEGGLALRVVKSLPLEDLPSAAALGLRSGFGDDFLRIGSVKAFADGALGPQTAAMLQPYEGSSTDRGMLMLDAETLYEQGQVAVKSGLSLAVHAIGDQANHEVLNAYTHLREFERAQPGYNGKPLRHRIEHVQVLHPDDANRLAALDVIASMQPIHATSDMLMADRFWGKRAALSYAWRTQLKAGATLAFGSDAPVESPNPWWGIHAAVTRRRSDGIPGEAGWFPEQRLSVKEALWGYTRGPAFAAGTESHQGQLAPGYDADLIILEQDPFTCPPEALAGIQVQRTMLAGKWGG